MAGFEVITEGLVPVFTNRCSKPVRGRQWEGQALYLPAFRQRCKTYRL
jgi:hypothetical protein